MKEVIIKSPLSPKNIYNLLFYPSKLFAPNIFIRSKFWTLFVTFPFFIYYPAVVAGMNFTGRSSTIISKLIMCVITSLLFGLFLWCVVGWFYNLRIKWSGAIDHDKTEGRLIMVYVFFIEMCISICIFLLPLPSIIAPILYILIDCYFSILNYFAVKSKFIVQGIKPIFWFLIAPVSVQLTYSVFIHIIFK